MLAKCFVQREENKNGEEERAITTFERQLFFSPISFLSSSFLPPFSKLPLFRRKLQKSLAFLPRHALANLQMRFLSRALSRSTTSIFVPLVIQPTNNFPNYLLIFFFPRNAPLSNTFLSFIISSSQFSFLRSSPPFFRCPSIFSSFLCLTEECKVLKKEGMIARIKKLSFFCSLILLNRRNFFISPLSFSFLFFLLVEYREISLLKQTGV